MLGAEVIAVKSGSRTLKDAINEAIRDWVANVDHTHYLFGTVAGPHPFPAMVRDFHRVIGVEARAPDPRAGRRLPDAVGACVGGGSNAIGDLPRLPARRHGVRLVGFEAAGHGRRLRPARGHPDRGRPRRPARCALLRAPGRGRPDHRDRLDLGRPGLPGHRPRARLAARTPAGPSTGRSPTTRRCRRCACCRAPRASSRPSSAPTRSPAPCALGRELGPEAAAPGQPLRPWRQGHGHRRPLLRAVRRGRERRGGRRSEREHRTAGRGARHGAKRGGPGRAGRLPARRASRPSRTASPPPSR